MIQSYLESEARAATDVLLSSDRPSNTIVALRAIGANIPPWFSFGVCGEVDPDMWFGEDEEDDNGVKIAAGYSMTLAAKKVCADCPVQALCADYAVENDILYGVWGGTTYRERRAIRAQRRAEGIELCGRMRHRRTAENTGTHPDGSRKCLECAADRQRKRRKTPGPIRPPEGCCMNDHSDLPGRGAPGCAHTTNALGALARPCPIHRPGRGRYSTEGRRP